MPQRILRNENKRQSNNSRRTDRKKRLSFTTFLLSYENTVACPVTPYRPHSSPPVTHILPFESQPPLTPPTNRSYPPSTAYNRRLEYSRNETQTSLHTPTIAIRASGNLCVGVSSHNRYIYIYNEISSTFVYRYFL